MILDVSSLGGSKSKIIGGVQGPESQVYGLRGRDLGLIAAGQHQVQDHRGLMEAPLRCGRVRDVSAVFFRTWDGPGLSRQEELGGHIPHRVVSEEELVLRHTGTQVAILQPIKRFAQSLQRRFEDVPILGKVRTDHRDRSRPISWASCSRRRYRRPRR